MATADKKLHLAPFSNEPFTDFSKTENRQAMEAALKKVKGELGREYPLRIGGETIHTPEKIRSINPSHPSEVVGIFQNGGVELANRAVDVAAHAFESWKHVPAEERAGCCFRTSEILRRRKLDLSAWLTYEIGKTWPEADADIAELIDFCEYYGREMLRLAGPQPLTPSRGEKNYLVYIPLGVGIVIPPWNFAAAIMGGMTLASIVTGNTVVVKPSSDSPTIAALFVDILYEAGVPQDVVTLFTGPGGTAGEAMVLHPKARFIAFTGSKEAGLRIGEQAMKKQPGQIWIKRTVLEMGGKDAIIVDDEADLDAAVEGVALSAFGYQGQKCSACSRAIVAAKVYDKFLEKLVPRVKSMKVGPTEDPSNYMGPVINEKSMKSILNYIDVGKKEGRLLTGGGRAGDSGYFVEPTVIADVGPKARIFQEEIFGPVLAVTKARDFDQALEFANDSEFGLTGAVYSKNPAKLEKAAEAFHVGNLYFNRKCTGAMVGSHPFGGFNMSGTDSKSGGQDYLLLFLQAKTITEKVAP
ncbi:MAG TPA: L-glutamate gamma-semialdehyde dehydrogenase [Candidatus Acidoferrales bacterium]|jgi:1-pyrroline-5-carboxylate dehydrogenase|nr:L-glutamate gamma-semialdehyde dehydrogenase [Candidatus Acidoferrales bacterium]